MSKPPRLLGFRTSRPRWLLSGTPSHPSLPPTTPLWSLPLPAPAPTRAPSHLTWEGLVCRRRSAAPGASDFNLLFFVFIFIFYGCKLFSFVFFVYFQGDGGYFDLYAITRCMAGDCISPDISAVEYTTWQPPPPMPCHLNNCLFEMSSTTDTPLIAARDTHSTSTPPAGNILLTLVAQYPILENITRNLCRRDVIALALVGKDLFRAMNLDLASSRENIFSKCVRKCHKVRVGRGLPSGFPISACAGWGCYRDICSVGGPFQITPQTP